MMRLILLLGLVLGLAATSSQQATLYEWKPGDIDRANGKGELTAVGFWHDFVFLERRTMFLLPAEPTEKELVLKISCLPVSSELWLDLAVVLEPWGPGQSNTTAPARGTQALPGDATWRYPIFNPGNQTSWHDDLFGGWFDDLNKKTVKLEPNTTEFSVEVPFSRYGYLIKLTNQSRELVYLFGVYSNQPPSLTLPAEPWHLPQGQDLVYLAIPSGLLLLAGVLIGIFLIVRKRRRGYLPLLELETGDIHQTLLKGVETRLIRAGVKKVLKESIEYGQLIGRGAASEVYSGKLGSKMVAVKKISPKSYQEQGPDQPWSDQNIIESIAEELIILSKLDHPNISVLLCIVIGVDYSDFGLVTQLAEQGNLGRLIHNEYPGFQTLEGVIADIIEGMIYLHSQNIVHRDLKPENVLIDKEYQAKITDFGISKIFTETMANIEISGTPAYMAPETFAGRMDRNSYQTDVYSFGVLLVEILSQERPCQGMSYQDVMMERAAGRFEYKLPPETPDEYKQVVKSCLKVEPQNRPPFKEIKPLLDFASF